MSETTSQPVPPTPVVPGASSESQRSSDPDKGRCALHQARMQPTPDGPWWPSIPSRSGERCPVCAEVDRLVAEGRLPF